jgi:hypothetical protein
MKNIYNNDDDDDDDNDGDNDDNNNNNNNNNNRLKVQSVFTTQNNITCSKICKQKTVTQLYTPEIWFVSSK